MTKFTLKPLEKGSTERERYSYTIVIGGNWYSSSSVTEGIQREAEIILRDADCHQNENETTNIEANAVGLPKALQGRRAQILLDRCVKEGWLDEDYQYRGRITRVKVAIIAYQISVKLYLVKNRWTPFEQLWQVSNLRTSRPSPYRMKSNEEDFEKKVKAAFDDALGHKGRESFT